ncbi:hypothetical protein B9Y88_02895 [Stenotrophomonas maltophilia]|nr:hypothetical protein B9Y88_02895 [Stenotrophomonas maltophilia]
MQPARRRSCKPANEASRRGIAAALAALYAETPPMTDDEIIAEQDRFRRETEASSRRQGELPLLLKVRE